MSHNDYKYISSVNGGLYTGELFERGAPWANVPVEPDVLYLTRENLKSANPPPGAQLQFPGGPRVGNNKQDMPELGIVLKSSETIVPEPNSDFCRYASVTTQ
jgi:hypothetical protein